MYTNYEQRTTNKLLGQKVTVKKINVKRCWIRDSETLRPTNCLNFKKEKPLLYAWILQFRLR